MPDKPLFSVIIPVYNGGAYLEKAIQSVIEQTYSGWELFIIDDGSADNSQEIAIFYSERDSRIQFLQHSGGQNKGVSASRNLGILKSKGSWIAPLDSDDIWHSDKLAKEAEVIKAHPSAVLIWSKARIQYEYKATKPRYYYGKGVGGLYDAPFLKLLKGFETSTSGIVLKKSTVIKSGMFHTGLTYAEDTLLFHRVLFYGDAYFIDQTLSIFRFHTESARENTMDKTVLQSRVTVYFNLLDLEQYRKQISLETVRTGLGKLWRFYIKSPVKLFPILFDTYRKVFFHPRIYLKHKLYAPFVPFIILISKLRK